MLRINIDTDQIIPALFLGGTDAKGYGANLFHGWRFLADGSAQSRVHPEPAALRPRAGAARRPQLRLRLVARARAQGAARVRLPRGHRAVASAGSSSTTASATASCRWSCRSSRCARIAARGRGSRAATGEVDRRPRGAGASPRRGGARFAFEAPRDAAADAARREWTRSRSRWRAARRSSAFARATARAGPGPTDGPHPRRASPSISRIPVLTPAR